MFFYIDFIICFLSVIVPLLICVAFLTLLERKILARIQLRQGPTTVGFFGFLQPFSDGLKLFLKETIKPSQSDRFIFFFSPVLTLLLSLLGWFVLPISENDWFPVFRNKLDGYKLLDSIDEKIFKGTYVIGNLYPNFFVKLPLQREVFIQSSNLSIPQFDSIINLNAGLLYIFVISSLAVYGIILAGWSSNSKYAFLGSLRSAAQMVSYEVSIGLILISILLCVGSLNLKEIVSFQSNVLFFSAFLPVFLMFFISSLAETNRPPFDLPEAEAELVSGYNVEYSAIGFAFFFIGEYANIIFMSMLTVTLFFGGSQTFHLFNIVVLVHDNLLRFSAFIFRDFIINDLFYLLRFYYFFFKFDDFYDLCGFRVFEPYVVVIGSRPFNSPEFKLDFSQVCWKFFELNLHLIKPFICSWMRREFFHEDIFSLSNLINKKDLPLIFFFYLPYPFSYLKYFLFIYLFVCVRAALPRYRYDQLMKLGWKIFLPFSLSWVIFISMVLVCFNLSPILLQGIA